MHDHTPDLPAIDWQALAASTLAYRTSKGFETTTWSDLPTRLCCLHSECRELEDAIERWSQARGHTKLAVRYHHVRMEIADITAYSLTILADLGAGAQNWSFRSRYYCGSELLCAPSKMVSQVRKHVDDAFRAWRIDDLGDVLVCIELVIVSLVDLRYRVLGMPGSIAEDVLEKFAASADRPRTHGRNPKS